MSGATGVVGALVAFEGVRFKAGLQSNRDGTSAVLTLRDGAARDAWSRAASRPRCSKRRDRRAGAAVGDPRGRSCDVLLVTCSCLGRRAVPGGKVASTGLLSSVLSDQSTLRPSRSRSTLTAERTRIGPLGYDPTAELT